MTVKKEQTMTELSLPEIGGLNTAIARRQAIPTIEQINLEHQLANSKANEAVQHATNCGLMLLQIKASLSHGEWLPWLKQRQESGAIKFSEATAQRYMRVAANPSCVRDLETRSINAALEGELLEGAE